MTSAGARNQRPHFPHFLAPLSSPQDARLPSQRDEWIGPDSVETGQGERQQWVLILPHAMFFCRTFVFHPCSFFQKKCFTNICFNGFFVVQKIQEVCTTPGGGNALGCLCLRKMREEAQAQKNAQKFCKKMHIFEKMRKRNAKWSKMLKIGQISGKKCAK